METGRQEVIFILLHTDQHLEETKSQASSRNLFGQREQTSLMNFRNRMKHTFLSLESAVATLVSMVLVSVTSMSVSIISSVSMATALLPLAPVTLRSPIPYVVPNLIKGSVIRSMVKGHHKYLHKNGSSHVLPVTLKYCISLQIEKQIPRSL